MGRNKYVGSWTETRANPIDLQHNLENLGLLLSKIVSKENVSFSHQDFVNWCEEFYQDIDLHEFKGNKQAEYNCISKILSDISVQWELFLVNSYSLDELQKLNFSLIELPHEWFEEWLTKVR